MSCTSDSECDDGVFCNGAEVCTAGRCRAGTPVSCDDGLACTLDVCNEDTQTCQDPPKICGAPGESGVCLEPSGECECLDKRIEVDLKTDNYPAETSWTVTDKCGSSDVVLSGRSYSASNTLFTKSVCVASGQYEFAIQVSRK